MRIREIRSISGWLVLSSLWLWAASTPRALEPDWASLARACKFTAWHYDLKADGETNTFFFRPEPVQGGDDLWVFWKEHKSMVLIKPEPVSDWIP